MLYPQRAFFLFGLTISSWDQGGSGVSFENKGFIEIHPERDNVDSVMRTISKKLHVAIKKKLINKKFVDGYDGDQGGNTKSFTYYFLTLDNEPKLKEILPLHEEAFNKLLPEIFTMPKGWK